MVQKPTCLKNTTTGSGCNATRSRCDEPSFGKPDQMNIHVNNPPRQVTGIDIDAPFLIARTYRELHSRRLPIDAASLLKLYFVREGRKTDAPYLLRATISEDARKW